MIPTFVASFCMPCVHLTDLYIYIHTYIYYIYTTRTHTRTHTRIYTYTQIYIYIYILSTFLMSYLSLFLSYSFSHSLSFQSPIISVFFLLNPVLSHLRFSCNTHTFLMSQLLLFWSSNASPSTCENTQLTHQARACIPCARQFCMYNLHVYTYAYTYKRYIYRCLRIHAHVRTYIHTS